MSEQSEDDVVQAISKLMSVLKALDQDARIHVLEFVIKRLGVSLTIGSSSPLQMPVSTDLALSTASAPISAGAVDIRSFAREKAPRNITEKVIVVAYYLAHLAPPQDRRDYIVPDDIRTYFPQTKFELPTTPPATTLANVKKAGYFTVIKRGRYQLNVVGRNLVAHKLSTGKTGADRGKARPKKSSGLVGHNKVPN
jgi:hypothetical protein